jgi:hypothetical protein
VCVLSADDCGVYALEACIRPDEESSSHSRVGVRRALAHRHFPRGAPPSRAHGRRLPSSLLEAGAEIVRFVVVNAERCDRCLASVFPCATRLSGAGQGHGVLRAASKRVQTAALSCPAKQTSEVAIVLRVV